MVILLGRLKLQRRLARELIDRSTNANHRARFLQDFKELFISLLLLLLLF